jgi:hypothetical protein
MNWKSDDEMRKRILLFSLLLFLLLFLSVVIPVKGSGEVTVKPLFEVEPYFVYPSEVRIGGTVEIDVGIKNNDYKERDFHAILSIQSPSGVWLSVDQKEITIKSGETRIITLSWIVDKSAEYGWYNVKIRVWTYDPRIDKIVKPEPPLHGFTVVKPGLQSLYQKTSEKLREALNYGKTSFWIGSPFEESSSLLISIYKDELEKFDLLDFRELMLEFIISKTVGAEADILKQLKEVPEKLKLLIEVFELGEDIKEISEKTVALSEAKDLSDVAGIIIFGAKYNVAVKNGIAKRIAENIATNYDFINIIVVRVVETGLVTSEVKYDVYIVSPKISYVYKSNNYISIESNGLFPFYIGRFKQEDLPEIIQEKIWGYHL